MQKAYATQVRGGQIIISSYQLLTNLMGSRHDKKQAGFPAG
jgi:hypothetical protein